MSRTGFWERALARATEFAVNHPRRVITLAIGLAGVSILSLALHFEVKTSNLDLLDPSLPEIVRFRDFAASFGTPNMLVLAIEGGEPADREGAIGQIASAVRGAPGVARVLARLPFRDEVLAALGLRAHFATRDGRILYLFVQPADAESAARTIAPFVAGVRARVADLDLAARGVSVGFTGLPQYALDDRDFIQRDITRWSAISFVAILALFVGAFRGLREPALAMTVLALAALVTAGVAAWVPGHLTLVSAFFFSILFGLGIDFGVHGLDGAEELSADGAAPAQAWIDAVRRLAPGLATGALTTVSSFFVLLASGFRGFAELGWLAGVGILIALAAMVTLLPALSVSFPPSRRRPRSLGERRLGNWLAWLQHPALALALAVAALASLGGGLPRFDGDYLALQPKDSKAVEVERRMVRESDFAPQFAAFVVADRGAAAELSLRLRDEPTVTAVRSAADFERLVAVDAQIPGEWEEFRSHYVSADGRQAVYAFPAGDVWDGAERAEFLAAMRRLDPQVTGMPVLADLFETRCRRALTITGSLAALLVVVFVLADFRRPLHSALALLPTVLAIAALLGLQRIIGLDFNPLNMLALPVVLGVSEDAGVHLVHRFVVERGDLNRTLAGAGRAILVSGATTVLGFGALVAARHRGLATLALSMSAGVALSLLFTLLVLPSALVAARSHLLNDESEV